MVIRRRSRMKGSRRSHKRRRKRREKIRRRKWKGRPQVGLLSDAKRRYTCPSAAGRFTLGRNTPLYMHLWFTFGREA